MNTGNEERSDEIKRLEMTLKFNHQCLKRVDADILHDYEVLQRVESIERSYVVLDAIIRNFKEREHIVECIDSCERGLIELQAPGWTAT